MTGLGAPSAIAVKLDVPWDRANQRLHLRLRLIGQDGEPVTLPRPQGPQPIEITGDAEIGRPAGLVHGADIDFPLAFQIGPLPLQAGQRYQWVLDIDGETEQDWHLTFSTRTAPTGQARASWSPDPATGTLCDTLVQRRRQCGNPFACVAE